MAVAAEEEEEEEEEEEDFDDGAPLPSSRACLLVFSSSRTVTATAASLDRFMGACAKCNTKVGSLSYFSSFFLSFSVTTMAFLRAYR